MERKNTNSLNFLGLLGIFFLLGTLVTKWIPEWTWRAKAPEITINEYHFFETTPVVENGVSTITSRYSPDVYIRVRPDDAADSRAELTVTVNGNKIDSNCGSSTKYFCHKIENTKDGDEFKIIAKNTAGEASATVKIKISTSSSDSDSPNNSTQTETPATTSTPEPVSSTSSPGPSVQSGSCLHYEAGRCWDSYEDEMYSNGLYDHAYGRYGDSFMPPDDCDDACQDVLEDAYSEGYYDYY